MHLIRLSLLNIRGNSLRSLIILICIISLVALLVSTTLIVKGLKDSLDSALNQLGADILIVPDGVETKIDSSLLMGIPTIKLMPEDNLQKVGAVPGVEAISPQIYLSTLKGESCCSFSEIFLVVYDPETDFTVSPWLASHLNRKLALGEVIGGSYIFVPSGNQFIELYGYPVTLAGNLKATGTGLDQTIFMTVDTAKAIAVSSTSSAVEPLKFPDNQVSSILVKVKSGTDVHKVAFQILKDIAGVQPVESPGLFGEFRQQTTEFLWGLVAIIIILWLITMLMIGLIFSLVTTVRRREMAVLRAIGATRNFILRTILTEAALLSASGAVLGITFSIALLYLFKDFIASTMKIPFLFPSVSSCLSYLAAGVILAIITIILAVMIPAYHFSRQELAIAVKE